MNIARPLFPLLLSLTLSACATSAKETRLFLLQEIEAPAIQPAMDKPGLVIGDIRLSGFLDQSGLVYQTSEHEVSVASRNRWASPLEDQLRDGLYAGLSKHLESATVFERRLGAPNGSQRIDLQIESFHGRYDGSALAAGRWQLSGADGKILRRGRCRQQIALQSDGYDALVRALDRSWQDCVQQIAAELSATLNAD